MIPKRKYAGLMTCNAESFNIEDYGLIYYHSELLKLFLFTKCLFQAKSSAFLYVCDRKRYNLFLKRFLKEYTPREGNGFITSEDVLSCLKF